ncbi:MAG: methyltransferase domain-containing protein, partial [Anaerolineales bacterium]|nr:methyltransferase domain-containing protein [Anaerolineales bacterium]
LMLAGVYRAWKIVPSRGTLLRAIIVSILAYAIAALWVTPGAWLLLKVTVLSLVIAGAFLWLGEFGRNELARARVWLCGRVVRANHRQANPSVSRDFDYWDRALFQIENRGHYLDAFRGEMKRQAHLALIARWRDASRTGRVLKTDLFEEASGADAFLLDLDHSQIVGMDISSGITRRAQTRDANRRAQYVTADARRLPFASGSFALIVSPSTLDHFADPADLERSLRELTRVLEQGGRLIVTLDNRQNIFDPVMRLAVRLGWMPYFLGHSYTIRELRAALEKIGLRVEDTTAILHNPRLVAAASMLVANRLGWQWLIRLVQRALVAMQRLEGTRWQYYTGSFIAALGVRQDG